MFTLHPSSVIFKMTFKKLSKKLFFTRDFGAPCVTAQVLGLGFSVHLLVNIYCLRRLSILTVYTAGAGPGWALGAGLRGHAHTSHLASRAGCRAARRRQISHGDWRLLFRRSQVQGHEQGAASGENATPRHPRSCEPLSSRHRQICRSLQPHTAKSEPDK